VSADLALASDPSLVERAADPAEYIIQCCERGKWWLQAALERDDLEAVLEAKAQAEAIRVYTVSKGYGEDARVSAEDIIRRAERGLGLAVRQGQADHTIRDEGRPEKNSSARDEFSHGADAPSQYVGHGQARTDTYAMTDGVSDGQFEEALAQAKDEGNLSRANVARKARAVSKRDSRGKGAPRRKPHTEILMHSVNQLLGTIDRLDLEIGNGLDESVTPELAGRWADDLTRVIRPLTRLRTQLKEKASG
jgi:hypothetical protein